MEFTRLSEREEILQSRLNEFAAGRESDWLLRFFSEVPSTMDTARAVLENLKPGQQAIVVSERQTAGRGRLGRKWIETEGALYLSVVFTAENLTNSLSGLSLVVGCALSEALGGLGCRTKLKWPNDILSLSEKKLCGILVESISTGPKINIIVGIGLNVNAAPNDVPKTTCLKELGCQSLELEFLAVRISLLLETYIKKFFQSGFLSFRDQWLKEACYIGRDISIETGSEKIKGIFMGVSKDGSIEIQTSNGINTFTVGDIQLFTLTSHGC